MTTGLENSNTHTGTYMSRGKERTQKQNTKHPPKKDLPTNDSALGDDAPTTSGHDQGGH